MKIVCRHRAVSVFEYVLHERAGRINLPLRGPRDCRNGDAAILGERAGGFARLGEIIDKLHARMVPQEPLRGKQIISPDANKVVDGPLRPVQ